MHSALFSTVWTLTADNASNNGTVIQHLNSQLHGHIDADMTQSLPESAGSASDLYQSYPDSPRSINRLLSLAHVLLLAVKNGLSICPIVHSTIGKL
jgi:hypothetical protein